MNTRHSLLLIFFFSFSSLFGQKGYDPSRIAIDTLNSRAERLAGIDNPRAYGLVMQSLEAAAKCKYHDGEILALIILASIEEDSGKYETAIKYLDRAVSFSIETGKQHLLAKATQNRGNVETLRGNLQEAIGFYMNALKSAKQVNDKKIISDVLNNIAISYLGLKQYEKAIEYHTKAMQIRKSEGWEKEYAASLSNLGTVYFDREEDSVALTYFNLALSIRRRIGDRSGEVQSLNGIAAVYVDFEENEKAKMLIKEAIAIRKEIGELNRLPVLYGNLADVESMDGQDQRSLLYLDSALMFARQTHSKIDLRNIYQSFAATYENMKMPAEALKYQKLYVQYKDSVLNEKNHRLVNDLMTKYETAEKENKIKLQESEIDKQKATTVYVSILFILVLITGLLLFNRHRLKSRQVLQEEKLRQEQLRNQSMITAQEEERRHIASELHDGLGQILSAARLNMESVHHKIQGRNEENLMVSALQLIDNSFTELREISHRMMPAQLIRFGLPAAITDVLDSLNKGGTIRFHFHADADFPRLDSDIEIHIFRIIQEWVNNIVRYSKATEVSIQLSLEDGQLTLMIEDNGPGFDTGLLEKSKGNGWYNINSRVKLIGGQLEVDSGNGKGTLFSVYTPVSEQKTV